MIMIMIMGIGTDDSLEEPEPPQGYIAIKDVEDREGEDRESEDEYYRSSFCSPKDGYWICSQDTETYSDWKSRVFG